MFDDRAVVSAYLQSDGLSAAEEHLFGRHLGESADILDLGVGTGRTTEALRLAGRSYVGVDLSPRMIEAAQDRFPDAEFQVADAADLSRWAAGSFDAVIFSFNGLDYVTPKGRTAAINEIRRVLRSGGVFIMSTHNPRALLRPPDSAHGPKAAAISAYRTLRRLRRLASSAFWTGSGMVTDPVKGGLATHMSTPERLVAEFSQHGFELIESVGSDFPHRRTRWSTEWNYFAFRATADGTPRAP